MKCFFVLVVILTAFFYSAKSQSFFDDNTFSIHKMKDLDTIPFVLDSSDASINLPLYFDKVQQDSIVGFVHVGTSSTITLQKKTNVPFYAATAGINSEIFEAQGVELLSQFDITTEEERPAMVFILGLKINDIPANRIMFFTGDHQNTWLFTATYFSKIAPLLKNVFLASFMTFKM